MDRAQFLKLLTASFYPILRSQEFKGSGTSLRRADGSFHHIVHIQGSTSATECYINLGAHLEFLPSEGGGVFSPSDFTEPCCSFRTRLQSRTGDKWSYGANEVEAMSTVHEIFNAWNEQGCGFFERFSSTKVAEKLESLI